MAMKGRVGMFSSQADAGIVRAGGGFSLLELMTVLAITGLLMTIAMPSYQRSVRTGGRAEGQSLLLQVAANQERFYADNNSYSVSANPLLASTPTTLMSEGGLYEVEVESCAAGSIATCFVATATPLGNQASDDCAALTLTSTGLKGATGGSVENCWR